LPPELLFLAQICTESFSAGEGAEDDCCLKLFRGPADVNDCAYAWRGWGNYELHSVCLSVLFLPLTLEREITESLTLMLGFPVKV